MPVHRCTCTHRGADCYSDRAKARLFLSLNDNYWCSVDARCSGEGRACVLPLAAMLRALSFTALTCCSPAQTAAAAARSWVYFGAYLEARCTRLRPTRPCRARCEAPSASQRPAKGSRPARRERASLSPLGRRGKPRRGDRRSKRAQDATGSWFSA